MLCCCHRSNTPAFLETMGVDMPWNEEAAFTRVLMHDGGQKPFFHKIDLCHTVSLGVGKSFAASGLSILQNVCNGSSVVSRMDELSSMYMEFCRESCTQQFFLPDWFLVLTQTYFFRASGPRGFKHFALLIRNTTRPTMSARLIVRCWVGWAIVSHMEHGVKVPWPLLCANSSNTFAPYWIWNHLGMKDFLL